MNLPETRSAALLPRELSDEAITAAIEQLFALKRGVATAWLEVSTEQGIVTLAGFTDNLLSVARAEAIAQTVRGVRGVVNKLEIRTSEVPDNQLVSEVEDAMAADPATASYRLTCRAQAGEVELRGGVRTWAERQLVLRVVKAVRGIRRLTDRMHYMESLPARPDAELATQIRELLRWNVRMHAGLVRVAVFQGKATLSGLVGSAAERSIVVGTAWTVGALQVDSQELRVEPGAPDQEIRQDTYAYHPDAAVAQAIRDTFFYDPRVISSEPTILVKSGVVTLSGTVSSLAAKVAAEQDARGVVGVRLVSNELHVRPTHPKEDPFIELRVRAALGRDRFVGQLNLGVQSWQGLVSLTGSVHTQFLRDHAEQVASGINGVAQVLNHVQVLRSWAPTPDAAGRPLSQVASPDEALARAITQQMAWNVFLHNQDVQVAVRDGHVTLRGNVEAWHQSQVAIRSVYAAGAAQVSNSLEIKMPASR
ncbi:BON domain-containing protein [Hymenobacter seoulensis]